MYKILSMSYIFLIFAYTGGMLSERIINYYKNKKYKL
jgi:hypothetical protein